MVLESNDGFCLACNRRVIVRCLVGEETRNKIEEVLRDVTKEKSAFEKLEKTFTLKQQRNMEDSYINCLKEYQTTIYAIGLSVAIYSFKHSLTEANSCGSIKESWKSLEKVINDEKFIIDLKLT